MCENVHVSAGVHGGQGYQIPPGAGAVGNCELPNKGAGKLSSLNNSAVSPA